MARLLNTLVLSMALVMCNGVQATDPLVIADSFSGNEPIDLRSTIGANTSIEFTGDNTGLTGLVTIPDTVITVYFAENSALPIQSNNNTLNIVFKGNNNFKLNKNTQLNTLQVGENEESKTIVKLENDSTNKVNLCSKIIIPKNSSFTMKGVTLQI